MNLPVEEVQAIHGLEQCLQCAGHSSSVAGFLLKNSSFSLSYHNKETYYLR